MEGNTMKHWTVDIDIDEHVDSRYTRAEARLHTGPSDVLGVARALADLAEHLRTAANAGVATNSTEASHGW